MIRKPILPLALASVLASGPIWGQEAPAKPVEEWPVSTDRVEALAFSPDGRWIAAAAGKKITRLRLTVDGKASSASVVLSSNQEMLDCAVSLDGRLIAAVDTGGSLHLFDEGSPNRRSVVPKAHPREATAVGFTADGRYVLTGGEKGRVKAWRTARPDVLFADLTTNSLVRHKKEVIMVGGLPTESQAVSVGKDQQIFLWEVNTQLRKRSTAMEMELRCAALSSDGRLLALGMQHRAADTRHLRIIDQVRLVDVGTGTAMGELEGENQDFDAVALSPDGHLVAASGSRGRTLVWDVRTGQRMMRIDVKPAITALAFGPRGQWLATGGEDGLLSLYPMKGAGPEKIIVVITEPPNVLLADASLAAPVPQVNTASLRVRGRITTPAPIRVVKVGGRDVTSIVRLPVVEIPAEEAPEDEEVRPVKHEARVGDYRFTALVELPTPGRHQVDVVVEDHEGTTVHKAFMVDRTAEVRRSPVGRRLALIVGVSKYADRSINLNYAHRDAHSLYQFLTSEELGPAAFQTADVKLLLDEEATVANINTGLREFLQGAAENDFVLVFFAGHGAPNPNRRDDLYLLAHDTDPDQIAGTGLLMRHVREAISDIRARHVLVLTDACHSAGMAAPESFRSIIRVNPIHEAFLDRMLHSSDSLAIFSASETTQLANEGDKWENHGVFTYYLLKGLDGHADKDRDKIVTLGEIMEYVRERVKEDTKEQQIPAIGNTSFDRQMPLAIVGVDANAGGK